MALASSLNHHDSCLCAHARSLSSIISDEVDAPLAAAVVTLVAVGRGALLLQVGQPRPLLSHGTKSELENSVGCVCSSLVGRWDTFQFKCILPEK